jgi:hypothetical protein
MQKIEDVFLSIIVMDFQMELNVVLWHLKQCLFVALVIAILTIDKASQFAWTVANSNDLFF